jgi:hypothetical protein
MDEIIIYVEGMSERSSNNLKNKQTNKAKMPSSLETSSS